MLANRKKERVSSFSSHANYQLHSPPCDLFHNREMQERVEKKARHERELMEKELQFKDVYIDPDEP